MTKDKKEQEKKQAEQKKGLPVRTGVKVGPDSAAVSGW